MAGCILDLYRSAVDVGIEWAPEFHDIPKPGCVILAGDDPFLSPELAAASDEACRRDAHRARRRQPLLDAPGPGAQRGRDRGVLGDAESQAQSGGPDSSDTSARYGGLQLAAA